MAETGGADAQLSGLGTQALPKLRGQRQVRLFDSVTVAQHILQAERQGRLIHVSQHLAEKRFVALTLSGLAGLRHIVAIRHRGLEGFRLTGQKRLHFMLHDLQRSMVDGQVMEQQHAQPALVGLVFADHQQHQRSLADIQAVMTRIEACLELRQHFTLFQFLADVPDAQLRLTPDHLYRLIQTFPHKRCAQDVMPVDHALQGRDEIIQSLAACHGEVGLQHVRITTLGSQVMIENPFLQRCQRVDVLNIGSAARNTGHDPVDGRLIQGQQRQHIRSDVLTTRNNAVGWHILQARQGGGIRAVLDRLDQHCLVFTQQGKDGWLGQ
ncbi:hypothetical protein ALP84_00568 [Pseudomonas cichorii]|uniref:Uncharacterized protein n=1 Tax=Pseudomonas cichorii TaxID=36746 RepID=A0A3M4VS78_PSECI|nr:hypothetical protein ALP84_00568 [Pseudomonas cichorii]